MMFIKNSSIYEPAVKDSRGFQYFYYR